MPQGLHILYAYATDGQDADSTMANEQQGKIISNIVAYPFVVMAPNDTVAPGSLSFGNQEMGVPSSSQAVTITNNFGGPLALASIAANGDFSVSPACPALLAAGASCTVAVTFTPSVTGAESGTLTITDNNLGVDGTLQTVSLSGAGVLLLTVSPGRLTFSSQNVGLPSAPQNITLTNPGSADVTISSIASSGDYSQTNDCAGVVAANNGSCTLSVIFGPRIQATGADDYPHRQRQ